MYYTTKSWKVQIMVSRAVVIGALKYCALLHSMCDLKNAQMSMQCNQIQEFIL